MEGFHEFLTPKHFSIFYGIYEFRIISNLFPIKLFKTVIELQKDNFIILIGSL